MQSTLNGSQNSFGSNEMKLSRGAHVLTGLLNSKDKSGLVKVRYCKVPQTSIESRIR